MRLFINVCAFGALLALSSAPAFATACDDDLSTVDRGECLDAALKTADKRLNTAWKKLEPLEDRAPRKKALLEAQRTWIKLRDAECSYQSLDYEGGSLQGIVHLMCHLELTEARADQLESYLEDYNR